tara:strand:- start:125 stop:460 length:336 start_codon:yes stop_codon:yes gene_type:complete
MTDKYIFKKKLSLRRKSKKRLLIESGLMFFLSFILLYINYLIPNKSSLLQNIPTNLSKSFKLLLDLFSNIYEIILVIFIFASSIIFFILLTGAFYRIFRIVKRRTKNISYE